MRQIIVRAIVEKVSYLGRDKPVPSSLNAVFLTKLQLNDWVTPAIKNAIPESQSIFATKQAIPNGLWIMATFVKTESGWEITGEPIEQKSGIPKPLPPSTRF